MAEARYPLDARIRLLVVEDDEDDFLLLMATLGRQGLNVSCERVDDADAMKAALAAGGWDAVISDHHLPRFSSTDALRVLRESGHEHFNGSLVVPVFDAVGNVVEVYGRKITPGLRPGTRGAKFFDGA